MHRDSLLTALPPPAPIAPASRYPRDILAMSPEELREEWLRQERALMQYDRLIDAVVDAVWPPDEANEKPDWFDEHETLEAQSNAIVAGIVSLHELIGRQLEENDRLRARVAELEAERRSPVEIHTPFGPRVLVRRVGAAAEYYETLPTPSEPHGAWWTLNQQRGFVPVPSNSRALLAALDSEVRS